MRHSPPPSTLLFPSLSISQLRFGDDASICKAEFFLAAARLDDNLPPAIRYNLFLSYASEDKKSG
jgi:hypothetical protein